MKIQKNKISEFIHKITHNKNFYIFIIILGFCLASFSILYVGSTPFIAQLKEGDIAPRTIYAPYTFSYPTNIDEERTEKARQEFESKVSPVFDIDPSVQNQAFNEIDSFFASMKRISQIPSISVKEKAAMLKEETGTDLSERDLTRLLEAGDAGKFAKITKDTLESVFLIGVLKEEDKSRLISENTEKVTIRNPQFKIERETEVAELIDAQEALKVAESTLQRLTSSNWAVRNALFDILEDKIKANTTFNAAETEARKQKARTEVPPIYSRKTVKKNELIVEKGTRLTKDALAKLAQITRLQPAINRGSYLLGLFILLLGLIFVGGMYFSIFEQRLIRPPKHVLLISINAFLIILVALVIVQSQLPGYLIPLAAMGMILTLLLNVNIAFIIALLLSVYVGFIAGGKLGLALTLFMGSAMGVYAVRGARRRSQIFFAGFMVSLMNFFVITGLGLINNMEKEAILREGLYGIANGIISSFIVIGLLPVFEYVFSLITNITLLELSDLSHPILKELTIKAPGTYHHSILVGNLAEEACNAIGANSLLARVGAYYHDIGKIEKAEYFVENEMDRRSRHEKLSPSMSALVITNHTKDGIEVARKYKLNKAIIDFISQHHGTSLIYYFYQKALEKVESGEELKEGEFRYPGPKPQTKEAAIVLLADSVEASSRMLSEPTPARIRSLVQKIINNKFIDGQLDECNITLKDLNKISESFVRVLTGIFHTRLEYPEVKPKKERKNAGKNKNKQPE